MRVDSHVTTLWNWFSCFTGLINLVHICSGVGMYKLKLWFKKNSLKQTGQALFVKSTEHTQRSTGFKPSKITLDKQKSSSEVQVMVAYLLGCFGGLRNFWMKEMKNYYLLLLTLSYTVPSVWISSTIVVHTHLYVWVSLPGLILEYLVRWRWSPRPPLGSVQRCRETKGCIQDSMWHTDKPCTQTHPHLLKSLR